MCLHIVNCICGVSVCVCVRAYVGWVEKNIVDLISDLTEKLLPILPRADVGIIIVRPLES